jgi:hypothetical protein
MKSIIQAMAKAIIGFEDYFVLCKAEADIILSSPRNA